MPPHPPPPLPTERKVQKGPRFAQNDPPHKNPGYGPGAMGVFVIFGIPEAYNT